MEWYVFAILAPALWGISNVIDKFVLSKYIKNPFSWIVLFGCAQFFFATLVYIFTPVSFIFPYSIFAILIGILLALFLLFYAKSMIVEEASRVIMFCNIKPLFVILLAVTLLNEILTLEKYIGISLLVVSAMLISYRKIKRKKLSIVPTFKFLLPLPLIWAILDVTEKYILNFISYWSLFFWTTLGVFGIGLTFLFFKTIRRNFVEIIKVPKIISLVFISESFTVSAVILFFVALSLGFVSLVSAFTSLQPFFVLVYTIILSMFLPGILKEEITKQTIFLKFVAVVLIFLGTYLIIG